MKKVILVISLILNAIFIGLVLLGMFKFNVLGDDVYVDGDVNAINETVIYGDVSDIKVGDIDAPSDIADPDAEAIAEAEAESEEIFIDDEPAPIVDDEVPPEVPATTTSTSSFQEPDNSPVEQSTGTSEDSINDSVDGI